MKRATNKKILKVSLIPMAAFILFALANSEIIAGTDDPSMAHYIAMALWVPGCFGVFAFWAWGIMPHWATRMRRDLVQRTAESGNASSYHDQQTLTAMKVFERLHLYIDDEKK